MQHPTSMTRASPSEARVAKQSRLVCYHQDTPIPLRHQERLSYAIPNQDDAENGSPIQRGLYFGLASVSPSSVSTPCPDFHARNRGLRHGCSDFPDYHKLSQHGSDYQCFRESKNRQGLLDSNFKGNQRDLDSCSHSINLVSGCSQRNSRSLTSFFNPDEDRFHSLYNRRPNLKTLEKDNQQKSKTSLSLNPKINKGYESDSLYALPSYSSKPKRFGESVVRGKSTLSGLQSNVDKIEPDSNLLNERHAEIIAYSEKNLPRSEHERAKATLVRPHHHERNNREEFNCEGAYSQITSNPRNFSAEYHLTNKPARGQFSSPSGAEGINAEEIGELFCDRSNGADAVERAVPIKQGFVRELSSDLVKKNREQSSHSARSVVQLVFESNKPDKEKEADQFITLIDESFADVNSDKGSSTESPQKDRSINGANIWVNVGQCTNQEKAVCTHEKKELDYCVNEGQSFTAGTNTPETSIVVRQSLSRKLEPCSNKSKAFHEQCSFEHIRRQLFNESGLNEERGDVTEEKTNCSGELSFVRTIHQTVGDKESVGESITDDLVYVVNESAGCLVYNTDKNPKFDAILKTPRTKLAENRINKSPFVRTVFQNTRQNHSPNDKLNSSGRPVSPFSDSIISAVAVCSGDRKYNEYLRLRRRDRRLKNLSEPGIFSTPGLRTFGAMNNSGSNSSRGAKSPISCASIVGNDLKGAELTEQALRAHTLALKANSPNVRRRPTLDQFFGKVSEQGLQDNVSEQSDLSSHSDSVLMVQRTNKVNLTPVSGLLNGGLRTPHKTSRALRLKAWKHRHENMFKSARTAVHENVSGKSVAKDLKELRLESTLSPGQKGALEEDSSICVEDVEATCAASSVLVNKFKDMASSFPTENPELGERNNNISPERAATFVAGTNDEKENGYNKTIEESKNFNDETEGSHNVVNGEQSLKNKSIKSDDSFEEVFVEPELLTCSPPAHNRSPDTADSSNRRQDSVSNDVNCMKDSLDVFVGSASAILERVKRLKLKYNHKTSAIPTFNEEKDENENLIGQPLKEIDNFDGNAGSGCLIPSPTLLKDSPKIKTIDKSNVFFRNSGLSSLESTSRHPDLRSSEQSTSSTENLKSDCNPKEGSNSCSSSGESVYCKLSTTNGAVGEQDINETQILLDCLDDNAKASVSKTKEEPSGLCAPLYSRKELANIGGMLERSPSDEARVFVTEKENKLPTEESIVKGMSEFENTGRGLKYEGSNFRDESRSVGLDSVESTDSKHVTSEGRYSKQRSDIGIANESIRSGIFDEFKCNQTRPNVADDCGLRAGLFTGRAKKEHTDADNEEIPSAQVNSPSSSIHLDYEATCDNVSFKSSPIAKAKTHPFSDENSRCKEENQTVNQEPFNTSTSVIVENQGYLSDGKKTEFYSLNGLSSKFEEIRSNNTVEISPLPDIKEDIESGECSFWRDGLSSKDNVIIVESSDSRSELAGISNKTFEGHIHNGILPLQEGETHIKSTHVCYSEAGEAYFNTEHKSADLKRGRQTLNGKEVSGVCFSDGLSCGIYVSPDIETINSKKINSERTIANSFEQPLSTVPLNCDVNGDFVPVVSNEEERNISFEEDSVDMARAKGVSDLKKQFENYQSKSEKKADITKGSARKQCLVDEDSTQKGEFIEPILNASAKSSSKLGALKSMFESNKKEPVKPNFTRLTGPRLLKSGFLVSDEEVEQTDTDTKVFDAVVGNAEIGSTENFAEVESSSDKESRVLAEIDLFKEKLDIESGENEKLQSGKVRKSAKIPPPVKRKPSLKKKVGAGVDGLSPKNEEKSSGLPEKNSVYDTKQSAVFHKEKDPATKNMVIAEEQKSDASKEHIIKQECMDAKDAYGTRFEKSILQNEMKTSAKNDVLHPKPTGAPLDKKPKSSEESKEKEKFALPVRERPSTVQEKSRTLEICGDVDRSSNALTYYDIVPCEKNVLCEDADGINAEETIANLISELEKTCILTEIVGHVEDDVKKNDIVQFENDNGEDKKEIAEKETANRQKKYAEKGLENNEEKMQAVASEIISAKSFHDNRREVNQFESVHSKLQDNYPVALDSQVSESDQNISGLKGKEKASFNLISYKGEKTIQKLECLVDNVHRNHPANQNHQANPNPDESVADAHGVILEKEMAESRSIDRSALVSHRIYGLKDSRNLVTKESDGLKKTVDLVESENDCGTNGGKSLCNEDNGLLNARGSNKDRKQKPRKESMLAHSRSNSSDSSLEDCDPVRPTNIDYDSLPSVGLPALLRDPITSTEGLKATEEDIVQQQQHNYLSYSSKALDIKRHAGVLGIYSEPEENPQSCEGNFSREALAAEKPESLGPDSAKQDVRPSGVNVDSNKMVDNHGRGLVWKDSIGNVNEELSPVDETESVEDCTVNSESGKSHTPVVIQSSPLTSERNNPLNVAKVYPYFHDGYSRKFMEPVAKFGDGIFIDAWMDDGDDSEMPSKEARKDEDSRIGCPITRDLDVEGLTMQNLDKDKLEVFLGTGEDSLRDDLISLGVMSTDGFSHWSDIEKEVTSNLLDHLKLISDDCLGITYKDIESLEIGKHKVNRGDGKDLSCYRKETKELSSRCIVQLQGNMTGSAALLSYQLLIPKRTLEKYLSLVMNHRCLIFYGQSGTGKSFLASKIAFEVAGRIGDYKNNNMTEPIHAVNVNAERWKEIKEIVLKKVSQSMPTVLVIDGFTPEFHEGIENLAMLLKQVGSKEIYITAALNQATQEGTVKWQNSIRWIWLDNNEEPVQGLLTRYLRKKFLRDNHRSSLQELFKIADWISSLWKYLNTIIETFHSAEQTIGPAMFFTCPSKEDDVEEWFVDTWNYSIAPYILHTLRTGLKLFGQRCEWLDPLQWIVDTYPWKQGKSLLANLKKIRKSDVGYWEVKKNSREMNSSSADQPRLMDFLRRLETLVDNRTTLTSTKPGTTQRRIYLESTI